MLSLKMKRNLLAYARGRAPIDTGNLRYNAISGKFLSDKNKFTIAYSSMDANYLEALEESSFAGGSKTKINKHKQFILQTYLDISTQLDNYFNHKLKMPRKQTFNKGESFITDRRIKTHNKSLDVYRLRKEVK